ncbi:MAG: hypothetical protein IPL95_02285 [Saprospiraceae bacterium]|nr:hypothetical protein [Saprospiraceae bacterium]
MKNELMTLTFKKKVEIRNDAWRYDLVFYDTTLIKKNKTKVNLDKRLGKLAIKSIKKVNDSLYSIQLKDTTFQRKELFWNLNPQNSN